MPLRSQDIEKDRREIKYYKYGIRTWKKKSKMKEKRIKIITGKTDENDRYETKRTNPSNSRGLQGIMREIHQ